MKSKKLFLFMIVILFSLSFIYGYPYDPLPKEKFKAKCVKVKDGDTIVIIYNNKKRTLRLYGIDTLEKKQKYGYVAKDVLSDLILNKVIEVKIVRIGHFGRYVAIIFNEKTGNINLWMLKNGYAFMSQYIEKEDKYKYSMTELSAKLDKKGIWKFDDIEKPWEYRRRMRLLKK